MSWTCNFPTNHNNDIEKCLIQNQLISNYVNYTLIVEQKRLYTPKRTGFIEK